MKSYPEGTRVRVTFTGTVTGTLGKALRVKRDNTLAASYFDPQEFPGVEITELKEPFGPVPGEVFLVQAEFSTTPSPWFVTRQSGKVVMASQAGIFSVEEFERAYISRDKTYTVTKAVIQ